MCDGNPAYFTIVTNFQGTIAWQSYNRYNVIVERFNISDCVTFYMLLNRFLVNGSTEIFLDVDSKPYSWIELKDCQWVAPPRLWEAVLGEGWIQKLSLYQIHSLFGPRSCTKLLGKNQENSILFFCTMPSDWPERFYYSIQVKPYATEWPLFFDKDFVFWKSDRKIYWHNHVIQWKKYMFMYFIVILLWYDGKNLLQILHEEDDP